jgi:hypothetical protein
MAPSRTAPLAASTGDAPWACAARFLGFRPRRPAPSCPTAPTFLKGNPEKPCRSGPAYVCPETSRGASRPIGMEAIPVLPPAATVRHGSARTGRRSPPPLGMGDSSRGVTRTGPPTTALGALISRDPSQGAPCHSESPFGPSLPPPFRAQLSPGSQAPRSSSTIVSARRHSRHRSFATGKLPAQISEVDSAT